MHEFKLSPKIQLCFSILEHECRTDQFKCKNNECIVISWQCDGYPDCVDQSDEGDHCFSRTCDSWEFRCNSTGQCIPWNWVCDGRADCQDGADEKYYQGCHPEVCQPEQYQCSDKSCIDQIYYCDGDFDCEDKSDEPKDCLPKCYPGEFRCKNKKCILEQMKCNGQDDCGDGSDEGKICHTEKKYCTDEGWYLCKNKLCINSTLLCNGQNDCGDYSDENSCRKFFFNNLFY